jgi:hypothetical protein
MKPWIASIVRRALQCGRRWMAARRKPAIATRAPRVMRAPAPTDAVLLRAQNALRQVLDRHPQARHVFAHLALLEQGLAHMGVRILPRLSRHSLERVRRQLLTVASDAEARPLLELLQPVIDAQAAPRSAPASEPAPEPALEPVDDFQLSRFGSPEISEVDATTYFEAMRAWQDTLVEEEQAASPAAPAAAQSAGPSSPPAAPLAWAPTAPMPLAVAA